MREGLPTDGYSGHGGELLGDLWKTHNYVALPVNRALWDNSETPELREAVLARLAQERCRTQAQHFPTRVLGCGGRDYGDYARVCQVLDIIQPRFVIHGAARGADSLVDRYAQEHGIPQQAYPALWNAHGGQDDPLPCSDQCKQSGTCRAAGFRRNLQMLKRGVPTLVVAFPGGRGTDHMMTSARAAHVHVVKIQN